MFAPAPKRVRWEIVYPPPGPRIYIDAKTRHRMMWTAYRRLVSSPTHPLQVKEKPFEKDPEEEEPNEDSKEASESGSKTLPPDYTTLNEDTDTDLDSTARSGAEAEELEDTYESNAIIPQIVTQATNNVNNANGNGGNNAGCTYKEFLVLGIRKEHGRMILESVEHGPLIWPTIKENGVTRTKKYEELSATKKIQADCDLKATNIILQGLPSDVYSLVNHHRVAKDLWERVQLLMQGTSLTKQERECKLYDAFDKFAHIKGESLHQYYLRFTQLINDINIYKMKLEQFQVNTKFLNSLPPEWSKFVTDVKLVRDLHTTNFDQLHAYLEQHELHANEVRIMRERNQDPLALSPQYGSIHPTQHYSTTYPSTPRAITYQSTPHPNACPQPQSIPQIEYIVSTVNQQTHLAEFPQIDSSLAVPVFKQGDDPIDAINKMMSYMSTVVTSRFPTTNNHLRNYFNPRQQATIHDGRVIVQPVQGRQSSFAAGTSGTRANISGTCENNSG
ncbi:hypothetical protein Tco_1560839 [Tanacetum coccineum]